MAKKNPLLQMQTLNDDDRTIWTSELIDKALDAIENGFELPNNPFYEKDIQYRKGNLLFDYSEEEVQEIEKCAEDVIYFSKYCYVMQDQGLSAIKLRDYQEEVLNTYQNNKKVVFMAARQIR